ncbi:MAG: aryl-sulfate sulfotransferase [Planctomycetes bacterium]|nr:aryl-sulfate sulfotransferase [Planctomycetota bacterium]MCB9885325.1 aryl-sulfate sulfotransferase [Planctomycetota bacterium]
MRAKTVESVRDRVAFHWFWVSAVFLALCYGVVAGILQLFPYGIFASALQGYTQLRGGPEANDTNWYYKQVRKPGPPPITNTGRAQPGLNLVTEIRGDALEVKVMDLDGNAVHRWAVDWFAIWPDASHVPERLRPRARPGTHIDGAALLENGDLVFNFEHLGLVRLDRDGAVVWRLPYQTHHSVWRGDDGNLWVCGQKERLQPLPGFPNLIPPFVEDTVLVVSPAGKIVGEWSVPELLRANGRQGLLCLASQDNFSTASSGDITHLNHVEPFPAAMKPGFFGPGDVLVSLRNINTVFVFDSKTGVMKFACTGLFVRQHDPHFVDGDTFSVFDNNNLAPAAADHPQSRIVLVSAPSQAVRTYFSGSANHPFFTPILGRHQWLANGNLLITDSCGGRAFELDRNLQVVWWYLNYVEEGVVGAIEQVERISGDYASRYRRH